MLTTYYSFTVRQRQLDTEKPELIEVKCPYTAKDVKIPDAAETVRNFFSRYDKV